MPTVRLGGLQDLQKYFTNPDPIEGQTSPITTTPGNKPSPIFKPTPTFAPTTTTNPITPGTYYPGPNGGFHTNTFDDMNPDPGQGTTPPPNGTPTPTPTTPGTHQENALTQWARPQLQSAYRKYLGREISDAEFWNYLGPQASSQSVQQAIEAVRTSPESAAYQQSHPQQWGHEPTAPTSPTNTTTGGGNGDYAGFGQAWIASGGRTVTDLQAFVAAHPEYGATISGTKGDKVTIGGRTFDAVISSGNNGGQGAWWNDITNGGGGNTSTNYNNDPNTTLLINTILQRLEQLQHPVADPMADLYSLLGLNRIASLASPGGSPYTSGEDAALHAQYMNPLTQARDAAKQQAAERLSARGIGPTSGLFQKTMTDIDKGYEQGVAGASNDLGVRAVNEKQRRADEQLAILHDLVTQGATSRSEQEARWRELLQTTAMLPGIDEDRLKLLLAASGEGASSPSSVLAALSALMNSNTNATAVNNANSQANGSTWGAIIGYILSNLPK